jgi:predicted Zn-dependent protease
MNGRFPLVVMVLAVGAFYAQAQELPPIPEELKQAPFSTEAREQLARALEAKDYRRAETILVNAINAEPKSPGLLILAARVFLLDKNPANSAIALKKAEKLRPLAEPERFLLAIAYLGIGRGSWARLELEKLPKSPPYEYWLARIDCDEHKYQQAIGRLRAVTAADPEESLGKHSKRAENYSPTDAPCHSLTLDGRERQGDYQSDDRVVKQSSDSRVEL